MENIVSVIDGRIELQSEIIDTDIRLRKYLKDRFSRLLSDDQFIEALPGYLSPDFASQRRLQPLKEKLQKLAELTL